MNEHICNVCYMRFGNINAHERHVQKYKHYGNMDMFGGRPVRAPRPGSVEPSQAEVDAAIASIRTALPEEGS